MFKYLEGLYKRTVSFEKKKVFLGVILATVVLFINIILMESSLFGFVLAMAFVLSAPIKLNLNENYTKYVNYLWMILCMGISIFLSQLLLNENAMALGKTKICLGAICTGCIIVLLFFLTLNIQLSIFLGLFSVMILATINNYVFEFRGNELVPYDLFASQTALNVIEQYDLYLTRPIYYAWTLFGLICYVMLSFPDCKIKQKIKARIVIFGVEVIFFITLFSGIVNVEPFHFLKTGTIENGFLLNFTLQFKEMFVFEPDNYSIETIIKYEDKYFENVQYDEKKEKLPDIIVIMDESYADFSVLGENYNTNKEVTPFFDSLQKNTIRGYALSSIFGGRTSNSEYEFLTGNTMAFLPEGSVVYQQYLNEDEYSMITNLKSLGYTCIATHPYKENGWNRTLVYPAFGFDSQYYIEAYPQKNMLRDFVSDQEMFEEIIRLHEEKKDGENQFIFGVTIQNHGGYDYVNDSDLEIISLEGYSQKYDDVEQYLSLINKTDSALEYLITYFQNVEEPVIIVFYGDHLPRLNNSFYEEVHEGAFDTLEEQSLQYKVPFMIWANYDIDEEYVECSSLNYLSNYVYEAAGIELPAYNKYLKELQQSIPAINAMGFYSLEKQRFVSFEEASDEEKRRIDEYEQLQYNCLFDSENRSEILFPSAN